MQLFHRPLRVKLGHGTAIFKNPNQLQPWKLRISDELAETLGVLLGDGCISRYTYRGRENYVVAFTGSSSEYWYYEQVIQPTCRTEFGVQGSLYLRADGTTRYHIYGERIARAILSLGIPLGKKYDACIPRAVLRSGKVVAFIRGLYHAEGSIYRRCSKMYNRMKKVYGNLLVVQIRMKLPTLMRQINEELLKLGIMTNRLGSKDGVSTLRITDQAMIRKFFQIIRPRYKTSPSKSLIQHNNVAVPWACGSELVQREARLESNILERLALKQLSGRPACRGFESHQARTRILP